MATYSQEFKDQIVELHRRWPLVHGAGARSSTWQRRRSRTGSGQRKRDPPIEPRRQVVSLIKAKIRGWRRSWLARSRAGDPGKSAGLLRTAGGPVEVYAYIRAEKAADPEVNISVMCRVLGCLAVGLLRLAAPAGPAPWAGQPRTWSCLRRSTQIHAQFGYYGSPRVHRELLARRPSGGPAPGGPADAQSTGSRPLAARSSPDPGRRPRSRRPEVVDLVRARLPRRRTQRRLVHRRHPDPHR